MPAGDFQGTPKGPGAGSMQALYAQLLVGLINGSFYALLSLGLAVIFGMLNIINFAHGALYMMGAFVAYFLLSLGGINYWWALLIAPVIVGIFGMILERTMLQWLTGLDHLYGLLLTFGIALIVQGVFQNYFGSSGLPYAIPDQLKGGMNLGVMGSIMGSIITGFALGVIEGLTKYFYPEASNTVVFVLMVLVLLVKPTGLTGRAA